MRLTPQSQAAAVAANAIRVRRLQVRFDDWWGPGGPVWATVETDLRQVVGELVRRLRAEPDRLFAYPTPGGGLVLCHYPARALLPTEVAWLAGDLTAQALNNALRASAALIAHVQSAAQEPA